MRRRAVPIAPRLAVPFAAGGSRLRSPPEALVITGPTAVGKSPLAITVARRLGGELISMDSRQVHRGLDVGTSKPSLADRARAPHHGLDLVDAPETYSAGRFARDARRWISEIRGRGHVPILVGGTGFFLRALTHPIFEEPALDPARRAALRRMLAERSRDELARWLHALDPHGAEQGTAGGRQRMARAMEMALLSGRTLEWWQVQAPAAAPPLRAVIIVLHLPRRELYARIDQRARAMLEGGMMDEVRRLLLAGYDERTPGLDATGYREALACARGEVAREEALARMQRATRRYARRQMTWFRHQLPRTAVWLDAGEPLEELAARCGELWRAKERASGPAGEGSLRSPGSRA